MKEKILLVDDEDDILNLLDFTLKMEGFDVSTASNGKEALDAFHSGNFDLLVTDIKMPVMDGLELLENLKKENADTEVIVLTGHASLEMAIKVIKSGNAFDFLQKPLSDIEHFIIAVNRAIEHRRLKKMEAELIESRKTEAMTKLAGGVAHQYNNALNIVLSGVEIIKDSLKNDQENAEILDMMLEATKKMGTFNQKLVSYAESGLFANKVVPLNPTVQNTLDSCKDILKPPLNVIVNLSDKVQDIKGNPAKLEALIYEILSNAAEATEGVGQITISTGIKRIDSPSRQFPAAAPGAYFVISVKDDGIGIEDEVKDRIFEPFFTTKFFGRGLGLPAASGIAGNHGGWIHVESQPGSFTEVKVFLPAYKDDAQKDKQASEERKQREKTVLIIEDNPMNLLFFKEIFKKMGFRALTAANGSEAIDIAETYKSGIGLAILDMILPDMGGEEVYPKITAARPGMKVIICSGYSKQKALKKIREMNVKDFLPKPVALQALKAKVRQWFDIGE